MLSTFKRPLLLMSFHLDPRSVLAHFFKDQVDDNWELQMDKGHYPWTDFLRHEYGASVLSIKAYAVDLRLTAIYCFPDQQHTIAQFISAGSVGSKGFA